MTKFMAVAALGVAMLIGCDSMKKKDDMSSSPKKMSVEKGGHCDSCDKKVK